MKLTNANTFLATCVAVLSCGCTVVDPAPIERAPTEQTPADYYGTLEPFASEAVYFIVTDRFVDGDPSNNYPKQGGTELRTFDRPIRLADSPPGNIGYLGGDFKGVLNNADYIADMGFTAIWLTPIVDNPDEAFTGGKAPGEGGSNDYGKTGYHGYWGVNFFALDEHLPSADLDYADLTQQLLEEYGIKTVLDIVCNHGSPSFSMTHDQPKYGEIYDAEGALVADHGNLHPSELDDSNPLHAFFRREPDLAELSDVDYDNPDVLEYFVAAHSKWIDQGAAAVRVDTIKHMPHAFWKAFADRIRENHPDFFMFAEAWSYDADLIAEFTYPENGGISVLDFPQQQAMAAVFGDEDAPYATLLDYLQLDSRIYQNPYDLMTFYDNHDMRRIDADNAGFIDANNWLFTSRGIPIVYYGSEIGFRAGTDQHAGNRDYFGQQNIEAARSHPVHAELSRIAAIRKNSIALQRGLQLNLLLADDTAAFMRIYRKDGVSEVALVLLNKSDDVLEFDVGGWLYPGLWKSADGNAQWSIADQKTPVPVSVPAHGVGVYFTNAAPSGDVFLADLQRLQRGASR